MSHIPQNRPWELPALELRSAAMRGGLPALPVLGPRSPLTQTEGAHGTRVSTKIIVRALPGTKLVATHDLEFVLDTCARVLVLDGGRLAADGPAEKLLADPELMEKHGLEVPYRLRR